MCFTSDDYPIWFNFTILIECHKLNMAKINKCNQAASHAHSVGVGGRSNWIYFKWIAAKQRKQQHKKKKKRSQMSSARLTALQLDVLSVENSNTKQKTVSREQATENKAKNQQKQTTNGHSRAQLPTIKMHLKSI